MKISKVHLKKLHQFQDIVIGLTYPYGHKKAGQPLNKICFIGQSGTGKTTILELIPKFLHGYNTNLITKIGLKNITDKTMINLLFGYSNEYSVNIKLKSILIMMRKHIITFPTLILQTKK